MRSIDEVLHRPPRGDMLPNFVLAQAERLSGDALRRLVDGTPSVIRTIPEQLSAALGIDTVPRCSEVEYGGVIERDGYRIEKLVFEATPGLVVPAHLYIPNTNGPHPAVVHAPGHWMENAKLEATIQLFNINLVENGFAVLCYDPIGQGERRVGWHQHGQLAPHLVGFTSLGLMVRDTLGAIDILEHRPDVDGARLGIAGASGGGFSGIFAAALDQRISAAAIACIVNTHVSQIRDAAYGTGWDSWADLCNQVPRLCAIGTMGMVLSSILPRRLLVANADHDRAFPITGAREVAEEVRAYSSAIGAAQSFSFVEVPGGHGLHPDMRDVVVSFLCESLQKRAAIPLGEDPQLLEQQWEVVHNRATARRPQTKPGPWPFAACLEGPVDPNVRIVEIARVLAADLRDRRSLPSVEALRERLGPFPSPPPQPPTVTDHVVLAEGYAQRLVIPVENGVFLDAVLTLPRNWSDELPPVLVVLDEGGKAEALRSTEACAASAAGCAVVAPDLRGTGESAASEFEVASAAFMLDRDLLSQRVLDVIRTIDFLSDRYSTGQQIDKGRILVWGRDAFGLIALIACAIDDRVAGAGAPGLRSLEDLLVVNSDVTPMAYSYGLLRYFDVDDLADLIKPRFVATDLSEPDIAGAIKAALEHCR